jgi:hypothetical protein
LLGEDVESPELLFIVGDSLMNQEQMALAPLYEAVRLRADYPAAHAVMGWAYQEGGRRSWRRRR